jgi:ATPase subunit of ABC transporter with duplicated ATPase domains
LIQTKTVWENVIEGSEDKQIYDAYNAIAMKLAEDYSDELMEKMTELQEQVDARDAWDIDSKIEMAMDALRCPPGDADVTNLSGGERAGWRSASCSCPSRTCAAARRTDQPPRRGKRRLAPEPSGKLSRRRADRDPRPLLPRRHHHLDAGARSRSGRPVSGRLFGWLEQKAKRLAQESREESAKQRALRPRADWIRAAPKARQAKSKARIKAYEEKRDAAEKEKINRRHQYSAGPAPGRQCGGFRPCVSKGFGDKLLINDLDFKLPPGGVVGVIGPNGAGKTTLFKMITGEEKPDDGSVTLGETVKLGYVEPVAAMRSTPTRTSGRRFPAAMT